MGSSSRLLHVALVFALTPLATGFAVFVPWCIFRSDWLMFAGLITIVLGLGAFFAGVLCLIAYLQESARDRTVPFRSVLAKSVVCGALLLANFPACAGILWAVDYIMSAQVIVVVNKTEATLESFELLGPGFEGEFGPIPPGAVRTCVVHVSGKRGLMYWFTSGSEKFEAAADAYVSPSLGSKYFLTVEPHGQVKIEPKSSRD